MISMGDEHLSLDLVAQLSDVMNDGADSYLAEYRVRRRSQGAYREHHYRDDLKSDQHRK